MATDTDKIINPFKEQDIEFADLPSEDTRYGSEVLGNLKEMQVGSGKYAFYSDESGIWLGSKKFATAPFSVDMQGKMKATAGSFSGTITGSTITGGTIQTDTTGERIVLNGAQNDLEFYNSSNILVGELKAGEESIVLKSGSNYYYFNEDTFFPYNSTDLGWEFGYWNDLYIRKIYLNGDYITSWSDITPDLSGYMPKTGGTFTGDIDMNSNDINDVGYVFANDIQVTNNLFTDSIMSLNGSVTVSDDLIIGLGYNLIARGELRFNPNGTVLIANYSSSNMYLEDGTGSYSSLADLKTAIVPTSKGYNALYCIESPEVWFMDFTDDDKKLEPMFAETTVPPYHYIRCDDGGYQVWGKRKGFNDIRFEHKTEKEYISNRQFLGLSKPKTMV